MTPDHQLTERSDPASLISRDPSARLAAYIISDTAVWSRGEVMTLLSGNRDLTSKEWAITALLFQGRTNAEIAAEIQTTEKAVQVHLRRIFEKTGCWNRTEIALWYLNMGVEIERRFSDRRETDWGIGDERRKIDRRHPPRQSARANEHHEINLDE